MAAVLAVVFVVAALHEPLCLLLGYDHGHDHSECPLCVLAYTPVLVGAFAAGIALFLVECRVRNCGRRVFLRVCSICQSDPRAPPLC